MFEPMFHPEVFPSGVISLVLVFVVLLLLAARREPGASSERPHLTFLLSLAFVGLVLAVTGAFSTGRALGGWVDPGSGISRCSQAPFGTECQFPPGSIVPTGPIAYEDVSFFDVGLPGVISALLTTAIGLIVVLLSWRRASTVIDREGFVGGRDVRPYEVYLYAAAFLGALAVITAVVGLAGSLAHGSGGGDIVPALAANGLLALAGLRILFWHWQRIERFRTASLPGGEERT